MKKTKTYVILGMFMLNVIGVGALTAGSITTDPEWTVMYYLNGDNLLSAVQQDRFNDIKNVGSNEQVKIAVLIDQNADGDTKLYYLENSQPVQQEWPTESNMADANTLQQFATKVKNDLPTQHYYLHLSSNRGSGWQGFSWDQTNGNEMMISYPTIVNALKQVTNDGANKLDIIGIETCMGGMTENAYQLQEVANYYIAYEDCGFAAPKQYSFPYAASLSELINSPAMTPEEFATTVPDLFTPYYAPQIKLKTVLACTDLNQINDLAQAINELAELLIEDIDEYRDDIQTAITTTRLIGEHWNIDFYLEPMQFMEHLSIDNTQITNAKNMIITHYNNVVLNKAHLDDDHVCGLSLYIPQRKVDYNRNFRENAIIFSYENLKFAKETSWDEFLKAFLNLADNNPPNTPTITGPNKGSPGKIYQFTLTATDPENDELMYFIDWGDTTTSGWLGPYDSGDEITVEHNWTEQGTFTMQVKAKDYDESDWGTFEISMPKYYYNQNLNRLFFRGYFRLNEIIKNVLLHMGKI